MRSAVQVVVPVGARCQRRGSWLCVCFAACFDVGFRTQGEALRPRSAQLQQSALPGPDFGEFWRQGCELPQERCALLVLTFP